MSPYHVLWTAGWDSTYRVLDLVLTHRRPVQPHYVLGQSRHSKRAEFRAQQQFRSALARHDESAAGLLLSTRYHRHEDIPPDVEVPKAMRAVKGRASVGWQYEWLARLTRSLDRDLELSIHRDDKAAAFLQDTSNVGARMRTSTTPSAPAPNRRCCRSSASGFPSST